MIKSNAVFVAVLLAACLSAANAAAVGDTTAIIHGRLLTISDGVIEDGTLVLENGRIAAVGGPGTKVPAGAHIYDASGMTVYPGLIDIGTRIGLADPDDPSWPQVTAPTPAAMIADAIRPTDYVDVERRNGITHSVVSNGSASAIPGHSALVQLVDDPATIVMQRDTGLVVNFQALRKDGYPSTTFGLVGYMRQLLTRARELSSAGARPDPNNQRDLDAAAFIPHLEGNQPLMVYAATDHEVGVALDLAEAFGLKLILCGLTQIDQSIDRIAASGTPAVIGPLVDDPPAGERFDHVFRLPAKLAARGIPVSIATLDRLPQGSRSLPYEAGIAVAFGLSYADAMKAITLAPAQAFGVDQELGSLEVGKLASVVIADGDPLDVTTDVKQVFINGKAVPMSSRQTRLRDEYAGAATSVDDRIDAQIASSQAYRAVAGIASAQNAATPPVAVKRPHVLKDPFGHTRIDNYYWLRDDTRSNPEMLAYLKAENDYADAQLAASKPLEQALYREMSGRIAPSSNSAPYFRRGYWYYTRFQPGQEYPIHARRKGTMDAPEQVLLDGPAMGKESSNLLIEAVKASPDGKYLAWAEDRVGRLQFTIRVKEIATGRLLPDAIDGVVPMFEWSDDSKTLVYIKKDPKTLLTTALALHELGAPSSADREIYRETDPSFYINIKRTSDDNYICAVLFATISTENRCAPADNPAALTAVAAREPNFLYYADHVGGRWVIRTNWQAPNFRLMTMEDRDAAKGRAAWRDLIPGRADVAIEDFKPFDEFIAVTERAEGNQRIRLLTNGGKSTVIAADETAYSMKLTDNYQTDTPWVRYVYESLRTPRTTYEVNAGTGERRTIQTEEVPGYDKSQYVTERVWATARDGKRIPIAVLYKKGFHKDGTAALLQDAYGAYGYPYDPRFQTYPISLADRGMVFAIVGVRGGGEMGRSWYDGGRLLNKRNTFTDFIDATHWLVAHGYAAKDRVGAIGGSASGLLMGAITNMAPEDYRVVVALVPFVDIVTTMLDTSVPLTTVDYNEWGNPAASPELYDYMLSYSPYDNVTRRAAPAIYVSTGLWDSQVQYWEPTKWVAKLRAHNTGPNPIVLRINMEAGHGGKTGRFQHAESRTEYLGFALKQLGVTN